jgi:hypothetical protein
VLNSQEWRFECSQVYLQRTPRKPKPLAGVRRNSR